LAVIIEEIDRTTSRVNELLSFANPGDPALEAIGLRRELASLERLISEELVDAGLSLVVIWRRQTTGSRPSGGEMETTPRA